MNKDIQDSIDQLKGLAHIKTHIDVQRIAEDIIELAKADICEEMNEEMKKFTQGFSYKQDV